MTSFKDVLKVIGGGLLISFSGNIFRSTNFSGPTEDGLGGFFLFLLLAGAGMYLLYSGLRTRKKNKNRIN